MTDDAFRAEMRAGCEEFARRRPVDPACGTASRPTSSTRTASYDDPKAFVALRERLEQIERTLGLPGNRVFYLSIPPSSFATVVHNLGVSGLVPPPSAPASAHFSRVIIEKPFGTDLGDRAEAEPRHPRDADREPDLPHRPLPRKRDGPEPAGLPLRQRHLRADLEQPLRRPRADHRRRDGRRRGARRLLRAGRHPARHGAEPPVPGGEPGGDGAAGRAGRRRRARRKAEGAQGAAPHAFK